MKPPIINETISEKDFEILIPEIWLQLNVEPSLSTNNLPQ